MEENNNNQVEVKQDSNTENGIPTDKLELVLKAKKDSKPIYIAIVLIIVIAVAGGFFAYRKMKANNDSIDREPKTELSQEEKKNTTESLSAATTASTTTIKTIESTKPIETIKPNNSNGILVKENLKDGDYQRYALKIEFDKDSIKNTEYRLSNGRKVAIKPAKNKEEADYSVYVDDRYIFSRYFFYEGYCVSDELDDFQEQDYCHMYAHALGEYIIIEIIETEPDYQYYYIIGTDGKLVSSEPLGSYSLSIGKNGIKDNIFSMGMMQDGREYCAAMKLSEEEQKKILYSGTYVYEYKNGVLDTKGKLKDAVYLYHYFKNSPSYEEDYEDCKENSWYEYN